MSIAHARTPQEWRAHLPNGDAPRAGFCQGWRLERGVLAAPTASRITGPHQTHPLQLLVGRDTDGGVAATVGAEVLSLLQWAEGAQLPMRSVAVEAIGQGSRWQLSHPAGLAIVRERWGLDQQWRWPDKRAVEAGWMGGRWAGWEADTPAILSLKRLDAPRIDCQVPLALLAEWAASDARPPEPLPTLATQLATPRRRPLARTAIAR